MQKILVGCSGWSYSGPPEKGGWGKIFYPNSITKKLPFYGQFFDTVEMDSTFYEKFYKYMTKETFQRLEKMAPDNFEFSIKVPETITHIKRLDINKGAIIILDEFLDKISPLQAAKKIGAILIQLPPSFTVNDFKTVENFLDRLPRGYQYALEFRHQSWNTEGPWEMLGHYNIAAVLTDSTFSDHLGFLSEIIITTVEHLFIRFHGRNAIHRYNYLYSKDELCLWGERIKRLMETTIDGTTERKVIRVYFNNHYGGKSIINALEFKDILGMGLPENARNILQHARNYYPETTLDDIFNL